LTLLTSTGTGRSRSKKSAVVSTPKRVSTISISIAMT